MNDALDIDIVADARAFMEASKLTAAILRSKVRTATSPEDVQGYTMEAMELADFIAALSGLALPCAER